jgi:hypothetical protein
MASSIPGISSMWSAAAKHVLKVATPDLKKQLLQLRAGPLKDPQLLAKISAIILTLPIIKNLKLNPQQLKNFSEMVWYTLQAGPTFKFIFSALFKSKL